MRYFHVVFTLPHELNTLVRANQALLYHLLFQASAQTLREVAVDPKHLGAEIGFFSMLHTWGQNLMLHPHLHGVILVRLEPAVHELSKNPHREACREYQTLMQPP